jgi:SPRY domain
MFGVAMILFAMFGYMWLPSGCHEYGFRPKTTPAYIWKSSASSISTVRYRDRMMIDVLDFPGVQRGTYTWKIKILREDGTRLGVVSSLERNYKKSLGTTGTSWGYGGRGDAFHKGRRVGGWHVGFTTGSIVTLFLDLTGRGTLSVSVDEKPLILVFDDMKKGNKQFMPAAFLYNDARIEFLGFQ